MIKTYYVKQVFINKINEKIKGKVSKCQKVKDNTGFLIN